MDILTLFKRSLKSIEDYKKMIDSHKGNKEYGNDIVNKYNEIGYNIEELTNLIEEIFSNDETYEDYFNNDDLVENISKNLTEAFNNFSKLLSLKKCEEKVALAYEWLFEVMLFTTDNEEIKSRITLNSNGIKLKTPKNKFTGEVNEGDKIVVTVASVGKTDDLIIVAEEIVDDFIYAYLGDKEDEHDLIIFNKYYIERKI